MDIPARRATLIHSLKRQLLDGPVTVRAEDIDVSLMEWRSAAREAAQQLGRPLTVYAHGTVTWVRLADPSASQRRLQTFG